jgi:hypothetical protein
MSDRFKNDVALLLIIIVVTFVGFWLVLRWIGFP